MKSKREANHALAAAPITAFLSTTNPVKSRAFYEKVLGLRFESDEPVALVFRLAGGVPLRVLVDKFSHTRFEPSGFTGNPAIPIAKSITDYIFRWLQLKFMPQPQETEATIEASPAPSVSEPYSDASSGLSV